jgi:hypothetical protein
MSNSTATSTATATVWCVVTQVQENYGAHDWDGTGECPQYWKMKGGNEYKVAAPNADAAIQAWNAWYAANKPSPNYHQEYALVAQAWDDWVRETREDHPAPSVEDNSMYGDYGGYLIRQAEQNAIGFPDQPST